MREMDLKSSFYISLAIHLFLFLLFSLFFLKNPFQKIETPTVVNIQFDKQLSGSQIKDDVQGPVVEEKKKEEKLKEKVMPVKKEVKKNEVNEKIKEVKEKKEKLEKNITEETKEKEIPQTGNKENVKDKDDDLLKNIDEAIKTGSEKNNVSGKETKSDLLSGGKWSGKARRTIFFPDIQSRLPEELRKKGIGYSVTAKIKFDKNGLATYVEIIKSSGNSKVDQIFNTELKKIRVEPAETTDEVIHTFKIQIR